jgi:hypothetical protein
MMLSANFFSLLSLSLRVDVNIYCSRTSIHSQRPPSDFIISQIVDLTWPDLTVVGLPNMGSGGGEVRGGGGGRRPDLTWPDSSRAT